MNSSTDVLNPPASRAPALTRRRIVLIGLLLAVVVAFFATTRQRADVMETLWRQREAITWAQQQQAIALGNRKLRAQLRDQLRQLAREPEDYPGLLHAASLYGQLSQYTPALFLLGEAHRLRPSDPEVYRAEGQAYLGSGQYDRAIEVLDEGLRIAPDDMELNLQRVNIDTILGWISSSRSRIRRLLELYGTNEPRVQVMAALAARQIADAKGSEEHLRKAAQLDPKNDKVWALLSGLAWDLGHRDVALDAIHKSLALNPNAADSWIHLAEIQSSPGTPQAWRDAEKSYRNALDLKPASNQAKYGLAICRLRQGDPVGQEMLERLVQSSPNIPSPLLELGKLYNKQGRHREAAELLARYEKSMQESDQLKGLTLRMAMQPNDVHTYLEMGQLHIDTGYPQKAIVVLRRALRLNPKDQAVRKLLVQALVQSDRAGEIREILAKP